MKKGELDYAIRVAFNRFDEWNDITGYFQKFSGYYGEILSIIEDSVKIGAKVAIQGSEADLSDLDK